MTRSGVVSARHAPASPALNAAKPARTSSTFAAAAVTEAMGISDRK
jgi:hypothetical protein